MTAPGLPTAPADGAVVKACCAQVWSHPAVRLLVGDAFRPGGPGLTDRLLDRLALPAGSRVVDVGCGAGATLGLLTTRGLRAVGLEYSPRLAAEAAGRGAVLVGDSERLPLRTGAFAAALMECVLSTLPDKPAALAELHRSLTPGGRLVVTDVTLTGTLDESLSPLLAWVACTAGAASADGYRRLVETTGFEVEQVEDHSPALTALVATVRRRLALLRGAAAAGILPDGQELTRQAGRLGIDLPRDTDPAAFGDTLLDHVVGAVEAGDLGYVAVIARRTG